MSWPQVALVAINAVQIIALAWIAAWQHRAAQLARQLEEAVLESNGLEPKPQDRS